MGRWDQWKTTCPGCNGGLVVTELTLTVTGEKLSPNTELQSDGFVDQMADIRTDSMGRGIVIY